MTYPNCNNKKDKNKVSKDKIEAGKNKIKVHLKPQDCNNFKILSPSIGKICKQQKNKEKTGKKLVKTLGMHIYEHPIKKGNTELLTEQAKEQSPKKRITDQNIQFFTSPPPSNKSFTVTHGKKSMPILQQQYLTQIKKFVTPPSTGKKIVTMSLDSNIPGKNPRFSQEAVMGGSASNYALYYGFNKNHTKGHVKCVWLHLIANQFFTTPKNVKQNMVKQSEKKKVGNSLYGGAGKARDMQDNSALISTDKNNLICGTQECNNFMRTFENDIRNLMNKKIVKNITKIDLQVEAPLLQDNLGNYTHFAKKIIYSITLHQADISKTQDKKNTDTKETDVREINVKKTAVLKFYPLSCKTPGSERRRAMREILHELLKLENKEHLVEKMLHQLIPETEDNKDVEKKLNDVSNKLLFHNVAQQLSFSSKI